MSKSDSELRWFQYDLQGLLCLTLYVAVLCGFGRMCWLATQPRGNKLASMQVDIEIFALALDTYRTKMGEYPPSDPAEAMGHIRRVFPRYTGGMKSTFSGPDEALYFWLGGPNGEGWSANPEDPFESGGPRIGPFFEFMEDRLKGRAYMPHDTSRDPYVYVRPDAEGNYTGPMGSCSTFPGVNPESFQIHCPGLDGKFGFGGSSTDSTGYTKARWDDMGNFCPFTLEDKFR